MIKKLITILVFLLFPLMAQAAGTSGTISGTVSGAIADGVTITITNSAGSVVDTKTTAGGGLYTSAVLANATYTVTPSKTGYIFSGFFYNLNVIGYNITGANFISFANSSAGINPSISVLPSTTVEVGQPVYFSATGSTLQSDSTLGCTTSPANNCGAKTEYRWNFGDGYACQKHSGLSGGYETNYNIDCKSIAVVHYFMTPGTYTVTLNSMVFNAWSAGKSTGTPLASGTASTTITVTIPGNVAPISGFEIQHANFNNRTKQYVYIEVPATYQNSGYDLVLSLIDTTASSTVVLETVTPPIAENRYLLDHTGLIASHNYVLQAQIKTHGGSQVAGAIWRELFTHWASTPTVTIDENNSISKNGVFVFPIASFESNVEDYYWNLTAPNNIPSSGINAFDTMGFYTTEDAATFNTWLTTNAGSNINGIGPGRGIYGINFNPAGADYWKYNINLDNGANSVTAFITAGRSNSGLLAYLWDDEPNLGGDGSTSYDSVLSAWNYVAGYNDVNHPYLEALNLGSQYSPYSSAYTSADRTYARVMNPSTIPTGWDYLGSSWYMGGKKFIPDMLSFDNYPMKYKMNAAINATYAGPYAMYLAEFDNIANANSSTGKNRLIPLLPAINPGSDDGYLGYVTHSADQVFNEFWLNIVHGAKGIIVFWNTPPGIHWSTIKQFTDMLNGTGSYSGLQALTPVILSANSTKTFTRTDQTNTALNRVDVTVRDYNGATYIIATRVTEPDPVYGIITYDITHYPAVTVGDANTGYHLNDVLAIAGGTNGTVTVNGIDSGTGAITSLFVSAGGYGYSVSTGNTTTCTRSGVACTGISNVRIDVKMIQNSLYTGTEPTTIYPVFSISGLGTATTASVYGESRNVSITSGTLTDTQGFAKNAVHIYVVNGGAPTYHAITVTKNGTGVGTVTSSDPTINCGLTCTDNILEGNTTTLYATPDVNSTFTGWGGAYGCMGTGNCVVSSIMADAAVTATFAAKTPPNWYMTISLSGTGTGTSSPSVGAISELQGAGVGPITAAADVTSTFNGFSGTCGCTGTAPCSFTMPSNACTVIEDFELIPTYWLTLFPAAGVGVITVSDSSVCAYPNNSCVFTGYAQNTALTIQGTCNNGWNTPVITGDCASDGTVTMNGNKSCTVTCSLIPPTFSGGFFSGGIH